MIQHVSLLAAAEAHMTRANEIAPMVQGKVEAMQAICTAFSARELEAYLDMGDASQQACEAVAWKALLTLRIEVDEAAAGMAKVLGKVFQLHQAAHEQRDLQFLQIQQLAQKAQAMLQHYATLAAAGGQVAKVLLEEQGVALDVPKEMRAVLPLMGANGRPVQAS